MRAVCNKRRIPLHNDGPRDKSDRHTKAITAVGTHARVRARGAAINWDACRRWHGMAGTFYTQTLPSVVSVLEISGS